MYRGGRGGRVEDNVIIDFVGVDGGSECLVRFYSQFLCRAPRAGCMSSESGHEIIE